MKKKLTAVVLTAIMLLGQAAAGAKKNKRKSEGAAHQDRSMTVLMRGTVPLFLFRFILPENTSVAFRTIFKMLKFLSAPTIGYFCFLNLNLCCRQKPCRSLPLRLILQDFPLCRRQFPDPFQNPMTLTFIRIRKSFDHVTVNNGLILLIHGLFSRFLHFLPCRLKVELSPALTFPPPHSEG